MTKIWHKFFLLAVLSCMPMLSQAQSCSNEGTPVGDLKITPFPGGWKVVAQFNVTITSSSDCRITPTQISGIPDGGPETYSRNGISVNIRDAQIFLRNAVTCSVIADGQNAQKYQCLNPPQTALIEVQYRLTGKSTATVANTELFPASLTSVTPNTANFSKSQTQSVKVPLATAPTCSFLIDPPNITLEPIKNTDIENLTAGTAINAGQKNIKLTVNCQANALSNNESFAPQFSPIKSVVLTDPIALNDGDDNGVGFKLFDPSASAIAFGTPLTSSQNLFNFTTSLPTLSKTYNIKYAKTSNPVKPGPVTSSITITFSIR
jgi:hypothetical protein